MRREGEKERRNRERYLMGSKVKLRKIWEEKILMSINNNIKSRKCNSFIKQHFLNFFLNFFSTPPLSLSLHKKAV